MYFKFKEIVYNVVCTTVTLKKWQGDRYIKGDRFVENIRQLKILGSCPGGRVNKVYYG